MNIVNIKTNLFNALKTHWLMILILFTLGFWAKSHNIKGYDEFFEEFGFLEIISSLSFIYLIYLNVKLRNILSRFTTNKSHWALISMLLTFALWTKYININGYGYRVFERELGFIGVWEVMSLIYLIYLSVKFRKILSKLSAKIFLNIKTFLFIFALYEEISFITKGRMDALTITNAQNEFNLHNLNFFYNLISEFNIPMTNISVSINFSQISYLALFLFLGIGSFIPAFKKFRVLFLERQYSLYCILCPLNIVLSKVVGPSELFIHGELFELFFYNLLILDTMQKVKINKRSEELLSIK